MALLLRKITKPNWYDFSEIAWLPSGSFPADPLADLCTKSNRLSVWRVETDRSDLEQVMIAVAAAGSYATNIDYALFDEALLSQISVKMVECPGSSCYAKVNGSHRDLIELSAEKLVAMAKVIMSHGYRERITEGKILRLLKKAVDRGDIQKDQLKEKLRTQWTKSRRSNHLCTF